MTESGAICAGVNRRYHVRVRYEGMRRYQVIGKPVRSYHKAFLALAGEFAKSRNYDRGDVLLTADYYDPIQVCEIKR